MGKKDLSCFLLIRGNHEPFNGLAGDESIHNLWDVGDCDTSVKKVIRFDYNGHARASRET